MVPSSKVVVIDFCHHHLWCSYFIYFFDLFTDILPVLKSEQKNASTFQARNNRTNVTDNELFDHGSQQGRKKKVSFLETYTVHSHLEDVKASDSHEYDPVDSSVYQQKKFNNLFSLQTSSDNEDADHTSLNGYCAFEDPQIATLDFSRSSLDHKEERILPSSSDNSETESSGPEEKIPSALDERCQNPQLPAPDLRVLSLAGLFTLFSCSGHSLPK